METHELSNDFSCRVGADSIRPHRRLVDYTQRYSPCSMSTLYFNTLKFISDQRFCPFMNSLDFLLRLISIKFQVEDVIFRQIKFDCHHIGTELNQFHLRDGDSNQRHS